MNLKLLLALLLMWWELTQNEMWTSRDYLFNPRAKLWWKVKKITSCIISLISVESFPICTYSRNTLCYFQVSSQSVPASDFVAGQDMLSTVYEVIQHVPEQPQQDHQQ